MIANVSADVLTAFVDNHLGDGETAHTDGWRGYAQLGNTGYRHIISVLSKLDQTAAEVLPRVHLIFSLLKRWILGTHQGSVSLKHLDGYLEEFTFRLYGALGVKLRMWMPYSFLGQRLGGGRLAARCTTV
ncbi:MAG TPA: transposase [Methyloceanibacter sp.]|nr:transposase [Methyloceanibacter sp.]